MSRSPQRDESNGATLNNVAFEYQGGPTPPLDKFTKYLNGEMTPDGSLGEQSEEERPNSQTSAGTNNSKRKERNNQQRRSRKAWSKPSATDRKHLFNQKFVDMQDAQESSPGPDARRTHRQHPGTRPRGVQPRQYIVMRRRHAHAEPLRIVGKQKFLLNVQKKIHTTCVQ